MYECLICAYKSKIKTHYNKHLLTNKHKQNTENMVYNNKTNTNSKLYDIDMTQSYTDTDNYQIYRCKFCNAPFQSKSSKYRHQSKYCKKNDHVNVNKLVQLLNNKEEELNAKDEQIIKHNDKIQKLEAKIDKLMEIVQAKYVNNGTHVEGNHNNVANIQLLNYNKTDYDFLTDNDYIRCFMDNNHCVKKLIEKVQNLVK